MVKSILYTLAASALCLSLFFYVQVRIDNEFKLFNEAVYTLYDKVESKEAVREDAYAVRDLWEEQKNALHVFLPHNDVSYIDYWLNEACSLIYTENYDLALGKLEVLKQISKNLPNGYTLKHANIF